MKILIISYYYPPIPCGGADRPQKMAKYLERFGHQVKVLAGGYGNIDMKDSRVIRIRDITDSRNHHGWRFFRWALFRSFVEIANFLGFSISIFHWWKKKVFRHALRRIHPFRPEMVIATYPPIENMEIGLYLHNYFQCPLIADFRDGVIFEPVERKRLGRFAAIHSYYSKLESHIVKNASLILTVSPTLTQYFYETYDHPEVVTLPNGYDEDDYDSLPEPSIFMAPDKLHLVHTGSLSLSDVGRNIRPFIQALETLQTKEISGASRIRIHMAGSLSRRERNLLGGLRRQGVVIAHGQLPKKAALTLQGQADLLLLFMSSDRTSGATTKLFEYLRSGRPILAFTGQSFAREIIEETGCGWAMHPEDVDAIVTILRRILDDPSFLLSVKPDREKIEAYSRARQMEKLNDLLTRMFASR